MLNFLDDPAFLEKPCALISASGKCVSFKDLSTLVTCIRGFCEDQKIMPFHRIGIVLENCWQHPLLTLALSEICSVMPINPALTDHELFELATDAGLSALIGQQNDVRVTALAQSLGCGFIEVSVERDSLELKCTTKIRDDVHDRDAGLVLLTSGTTGLPKRVPIRTCAMLKSAQTIAHTLKLGENDRAVHALPMFHIGAVVDLFLAPLLVGGSVVFAKGQSPFKEAYQGIGLQ
jgi:acyl-CoA synthetase (AMP-forming)/AMP-acid ligase II